MTAQVPSPPFTQQQQQIMSGRTTDERIGALEVRVGALAEGIDKIMTKLDSQGKLPWAPLISAGALAVTLIVGIGGMAFNPLKSGIDDLKNSIVKFEARTERFVPREDLDARFNGAEKNLDDRFRIISDRRNDLQARTDDRMARIERDLEAIQKILVPRGEHAEVWAGQRVKDDNLQRQLDELRNNLGQLNSPRDTIQRMLQRIDELETALRRR